ncbi:hypothetical protein [Streptosporangium longisporum]|uniref:DUF4367 domain-containing protein n=1 Tax=Streptosporangium longisporum TaxID=46187 RepID=A0ABN3XT95_9ACTN
MSAPESDLRAPGDDLRRIMADEVERLHAPLDLVDRVLRASRKKRTNRIRLTALAAAAAAAAAAAVAVVGVVTPLSLDLGPDGPATGGSRPAGRITVSGTPGPDVTAGTTPEPPAIDDSGPPPASEPGDLGDLGDGRAFRSIRVGYLPEGLLWSNWSLDRGEEYTTSWDYKGDGNGAYCVQIYVHEGRAVQEADERVREYREEGTGKETTVGDDRTGYLVRQDVGEDGGNGTPTLFLSLGEGRRVEVMLGPGYADDLGSPEAVDRELRRIAAGLSAVG